MDEEKNDQKKGTVDSFASMFKEFGNAVAEIFNDPKLKEKAKEFGESAVESAKALGERFKDEDVKSKFKDVGKAAQEFGQNVSESFKDEKKTSDTKKSTDTSDEQDDELNEADIVETELDKKIEKKIDEKLNKIGHKTEEIDKKIDDYFKNTRGGRIAGYSIAIFWNLAFLIFFNFYYEYIAVYTTEGRIPIITEGWRAFLPILTIALVASIVGNIVLIIHERYELRQIIDIVTNLLGIAAVITLLYLFPFDFSVIPHGGLSLALTPIVTIVLILIAVGIGVGILVRFIKLIIHLSKN